MGFEAPRKIYKLIFADEDMEGLEVRVRTTSMGNILAMAELDGMDAAHLSPEDIIKLRESFGFLADALVSWNLEEDGVAVPTTVDGLLSQDPEFIFGIIKAWTGVMTTVPAPLAPPSQDGSQLPGVSIPMEDLTSNLAS